MLIEQHRIEKPWGYEVIWAKTGRYVGKVLVINGNHRLSRQYHKIKEETIMVNSGTLLLEIGPPGEERELVLKEGDNFHIKPNTVHRFSAPFGTVELFEVSTPELNDVVRLEDDYNRE